MKRIAIFDLIFYAAIPYFIWNFVKEPLGDYYSMLLSTIPGIFYTGFRFYKEKQFNITGLFIISSLCCSASVNLLSRNAETMLWNQVYLGYFFVAVFLISMIVKKPLALYFAADFAVLQGHERASSIALFSSKGLLNWFQLLTALFVFRGLCQNLLKAWLIAAYGVDGYGKIIIYLNITEWIFSSIITLAFIIVSFKIRKFSMKNGFTSSLSELNT